MIIKIEEPRLVTNIDAFTLESKRNVGYLWGLFVVCLFNDNKLLYLCKHLIKELSVRTLRFRQWTNTITRDCDTVNC